MNIIFFFFYFQEIAPDRDTLKTGVKNKMTTVSTSKVLTMFCRENELLRRNDDNKKSETMVLSV